MRRRNRKSEESAIDLTPMLDVVFIMLIFFIVTTSFVRESGIDVNRPSAKTSKSKPKGNILIAIKSNGDVWIDGRNIDIRAVRANVEKLLAEYPDGSVIVQSDTDSKTGVLVEVMDRVREAGIENISIATTKK
ncbi:MAG: biopolymer transporter ExbD [Campylobacterales bacterium]|nr:biopolymer transporter ExbD [Campylobacterales bacterium]